MIHNSFTRYYGNDRASKVIYGTILIFAYLITQDIAETTTALSLAMGTFFAAIAIVLAEVYSEILGKTIKQKNKLTQAQRLEVEKDSLAIISVSLWPALFFLMSYAGLFGVQTAFTLSYILYLLILFIFSYWASRLSNHSEFKAIAIATIITTGGLLVVTIKYALGH